MVSVKLKRVTSPKIIRSILLDSEIYSRIREDGVSLEKAFINPKKDVWAGFYVNEAVIGIGYFHALNGVTLGFHIHILAPYRERFAYECGELVVRCFVEDFPGFEKLNVKIPTKYPDVYEYTKKFGFVDEGLDRFSWKQDGILYGQWCLGLTKEEARSWQQQEQSPAQ